MSIPGKEITRAELLAMIEELADVISDQHGEYYPSCPTCEKLEQARKMVESEKVRPYTIFVDLDGTLIRHNYEPFTIPDVFLPHSLDRLEAWHKLGHLVVITTARNPLEAAKPMAIIRQRLVDDVAVIYGCSTGIRVLINDRGQDGQDKAFAVNVDRNKGLDGVVLE